MPYLGHWQIFKKWYYIKPIKDVSSLEMEGADEEFHEDKKDKEKDDGLSL